jgi:hypothetical protein
MPLDDFRVILICGLTGGVACNLPASTFLCSCLGGTCTSAGALSKAGAVFSTEGAFLFVRVNVGEPSDEEDELELLGDREREVECLLDIDLERDGEGDRLIDLSLENFDLVRGLLEIERDRDFE